MLNLSKQKITMLHLFLMLSIAMYPNLGFSANDPLVLVKTAVDSSVSTFQLICLSVAGFALILTALGGAFGRLDVNRMLQIFSAIIIIAGSVLIVDFIQ